MALLPQVLCVQEHGSGQVQAEARCVAVGSGEVVMARWQWQVSWNRGDQLWWRHGTRQIGYTQHWLASHATRCRTAGSCAHTTAELGPPGCHRIGYEAAAGTHLQPCGHQCDVPQLPPVPLQEGVQPHVGAGVQQRCAQPLAARPVGVALQQAEHGLLATAAFCAACLLRCRWRGRCHKVHAACIGILETSAASLRDVIATIEAIHGSSSKREQLPQVGQACVQGVGAARVVRVCRYAQDVCEVGGQLGSALQRLCLRQTAPMSSALVAGMMAHAGMQGPRASCQCSLPTRSQCLIYHGWKAAASQQQGSTAPLT